MVITRAYSPVPGPMSLVWLFVALPHMREPRRLHKVHKVQSTNDLRAINTWSEQQNSLMPRCLASLPLLARITLSSKSAESSV